MSTSLFSDFPPSTGNWEQLVESELKKPGAAQTLSWHTDEGFIIEPYQQQYLSADVPSLANAIAALIQRKPDTEFYNYQIFASADPLVLAKKIQDALNGGVNGLCIIGDYTSEELDKALTDVMTEYLLVIFLSKDPQKMASAFSQRLNKLGIDKSRQLGTISFSPLQTLAETGTWKSAKTEDLEVLKSHLQFMASELPAMKGICVNASVIANGGGTITQQIAYALAQGNEYLNWASEAGLDLKQVANQMEFHFSFGTNFLIESVKTRSFKWLWNIILKQYGIEGATCFVSSCTSTIGSSVYDSHNNLLRYTTSAMSAILSGSDAHTTLPFDSEYRMPSDFSDRIARNITNLLLEESFLGKVQNVTDGSFTFDNIQYQLCENAWALFQQWEAKGGYIAGIEGGIIKADVELSAEKLKEKFAANQLVILGVNKYPNKNEVKKAEWNGSKVTANQHPLAIQPFRLAESTENERLNQE